ncbi:MAG TPA: glutamine amidotransferase [Verrucomicrobiae bacterium]|jgi:uncharacterized membrane protein
MFLSTVFLSGRDWLLPAVVALGASWALLFWAYRRAPATPGLRALCVFLKLLGVLALAACLLEPLWSGQRAKPGANFFVLLADNSQGMQIKDRGETRSRGEVLRNVLAAEKAEWPAQLDENFQVRRYLFDSRLQATKDFSELIFDGRASSIGLSLRTIAERFKGQPLAGVLLLTDGNATDLSDAPPDLAGLPPVYPVVIGTDDPVKDIAVNKVTVSQTAFEDAPVSVQADVTAVGYSGESIVAQIIEVAQASSPTRPPADARSATNAPLPKAAPAPPASGAPERVVAEQTLKAARDGDVMPFRFQIKPEKTGVLFYRLRVSARGEQEQFTKSGTSTEATLANNSRVLVVDRGSGPYRVLYVAGRPNWEYKFLHRAIEDDQQLELVGLIRIAKREPKFDFRGRAGESSNPLFRGFGNQSKEEVERYDQPVLIRLNTRDEIELRGGFPKLPEELYAYHAVIIDDLEAEFFTPDQMVLLQKFVSERGGGFMMLGGAESFAQGKFHRTPIGDMLPVYLDHIGETKPPAEMKLNLTREGWLQPWARLRNNETDEKNRLGGMPTFEVLNRVRGLKPGASVIATVKDASATEHPAVIVQRFGHGRTAALAIGDLWHWGLRDEQVHRDMDKAWRQLLRWLVADVPEKINLQVEHQRDDPNQAVLLQVRVRDPKFQPLDNAAVAITVQPLAGEPRLGAIGGQATNTIRLNAEPALTEPGLYQATYVPRDTGGYFAEATVTNAVGAEVGHAAAGWTSDLAAEEFRSLKPNRALLEMIAKKTGGEIIVASKLDEFARALPARHAPIIETWSLPLWHRSSVFLFALICFVAEWGLRRWKGLA